MASPSHTGSASQSDQPAWLMAAVELFRVRGYLTLFVRIGYELVLIVSGPSGEAAIIDLSHEPSSFWNDTWTGMRQVLPRVPVVVVISAHEPDEFALEDQVPVTRMTDPVEPEQLVRAVEHLLHQANSGP